MCGCAGFVPLLLTEDVTMTGYIPLAGRSSTLVYVPASSNKVNYWFLLHLALFYYSVGIEMYFEFDGFVCNCLLVFIDWGVYSGAGARLCSYRSIQDIRRLPVWHPESPAAVQR